MKNENSNKTNLEQTSDANDHNLEEGISIMGEELRKQISGGIAMPDDSDGVQMHHQMIKG